MKRNEIAILMAAGLGERMRPLTENTPKPLIEVAGEPMIETVIRGLQSRGVSEFFVVTGYLGGQFRYLEERYEHLHIVENKDFATVNNISSIYAVSDVLMGAEADVFVCEADLYVKDASLFACDLSHSCYFAKFVPGHSDDWVFDVDVTGRITRVGKVGDDLFNMVGIAYFQRNDARALGRFIQEAYGTDGFEKLFWDDVVDRHLDELNLTIHEVQEGQIFEIDTVEELERIEARIQG